MINLYCKACNQEKEESNFYSFEIKIKNENYLKQTITTACKDCLSINSIEFLFTNKEHNQIIKNPKPKSKSVIDSIVNNFQQRKKNRLKTLLTNFKNKIIHNNIEIPQDKIIKEIGCTKEFFRKYIESQFLEGMTWENYGVPYMVHPLTKNPVYDENGYTIPIKSWNIDHIRPVSDFYLLDNIDFSLMNHWENLRPMWAIDNIKKGNRLINSVNDINMLPLSRICTTCKTEKSLNEFRAQAKGRYGKKSVCKPCDDLTQSKRYNKKSDIMIKQATNWQANPENKEKIKEYQKKWRAKRANAA